MKTIWLIGASEGIGRALAAELGQTHRLILSARSMARLQEIAQELPVPPILLPLDVCQLGDAVHDQLNPHLETIDCVIYCAGYYQPMSASAMQLREVERMIEINLTGAVRILDCIIPTFIQKKAGHIVLIGSIAGYRGLPNNIGYGFSKAGLMHLAENLKCDLQAYGINVQVINPGFVQTRLTALNQFYMPALMTTQAAAQKIAACLEKNRFAYAFPFVFTRFVRCLSYLPDRLYFWLMKKIQ